MPEYNEKGERMVTMKVPAKAHAAVKMLRKRYGVRKLDEALWAFIMDKDSALADAALKVAELEEQIKQIKPDEDAE